MMRHCTLFLAVIFSACAGSSATDTDRDGTDTEGTDTEGTETDTQTGPCAEPVVIFEQYEGSTQDVTDYFKSGEYITLGVPGELRVCPGTWYSRVLLRANIDVVGLGDKPEDTVLSGGESGTILDVSGPGVSVSARNVTFDRGAGLDVDHNSGGGGIYCEQDASVTVQRSLFTRNVANDGSGIYTRNCTIDVKHSRFLDNNSEDDGGAITLWYSTGTFDNVTITGNSALDGGGMALFDSKVTMTNSIVSDNKASNFGAGIWGANSELDFTDVTLSGNTNDGSDYGGGLIVHGSATLTRVTFDDNTAPLGGGLYVYYDAVVNGQSCDFSRNRPQDIYAASAQGGKSLSGGAGYSFECAESTCSGR